MWYVASRLAANKTAESHQICPALQLQTPQVILKSRVVVILKVPYIHAGLVLYIHSLVIQLPTDER